VRIEAAKKKAAEEAEAARAADQDHQRKVNRAAVEAIVAILGRGAGRDVETAAKAIVSAIAKGKIPQLQIQY
jgi:thioredoxin-like negative regulator of GroEL